MTPDELDKKLRDITDHERRYRAGWVNPTMEEELETLHLRGRKLKVLRLEPRLKPLAGGKHSRFIAYPAHVHPWVELNYMYSGSCKQRINGHEVELSQGQTILLNQGTVHELPVLGEEDILLNIYVRKEYLATGILNRLSKRSIITQLLADSLAGGLEQEQSLFFESQDSRRLPLYIQEFFCELFDPSNQYQDVLDGLFGLILTELVSVYRQIGTEAAAGKATDVLPVLRYIENNYQTATLHEAAERFALNPDYLSRLLRKKTGNTFKDLLRKQRLTEAREMLMTTDLPIDEIARRCGYTNLTSFYRKFKEYYATTPAGVRSR